MNAEMPTAQHVTTRCRQNKDGDILHTNVGMYLYRNARLHGGLFPVFSFVSQMALNDKWVLRDTRETFRHIFVMMAV